MDLTNCELFKDLTTVSIKDKFFDLHNDYNCKIINYDLVVKVLKLIFEPCRSNVNSLSLEFNEARISNFTFNFSYSQDANTLNAFYRGRFESDGLLLEYSKLNESYFYLDFQEDDKFEVFAKKVSLIELIDPS